MTPYSWFNLVLAAILVPLSLSRLRTAAQRGIAFRTAAVMTLVALPWDFVAIHLQVWTYRDPGFRIYGVPLNDLVFIFLCTLFSATLLIAKSRANDLRTAQPQPQAEYRGENCPSS